jgi:UDP-N-acetylglucosamine acyltransferase
LGAVSQDLKYKGEKAFVEIGDDTVFRECVTVHKATADKVVTRIGKNCLIMAESHVAHDVQIGNHCIIANSAAIAGHVVIGDYVTIEGMVAIQQFVKIGDYSFIGGCSVIRKDIPPYIRASRTKTEFCVYIGVNTIGLKRRGFSEEEIVLIEKMYKILYIHHKNFTNSKKEIEETIQDSKYKDEVLNFIEHSASGIIKGLV